MSGADFECRNECKADRDRVKDQGCASDGVCVEEDTLEEYEKGIDAAGGAGGSAAGRERTMNISNAEQGLIQLPGAPNAWIWAFTCPMPECACRTAIVLSAPGGRETLRNRRRPVAEAWLRGGHYGQAALDLQGVTAFAVNLDTRALYPPLGDAPLDVAAHPDVEAVVERLDDDVLDAVARVWHLGKGEQPPPEPGAGGAKIEVEGWRPGDLVIWDDTQPALRGDIYVLVNCILEAVELYCVEQDCNCGKVIVDFNPVVPRGTPYPGHIEFDSDGAYGQSRSSASKAVARTPTPQASRGAEQRFLGELPVERLDSSAPSGSGMLPDQVVGEVALASLVGGERAVHVVDAIERELPGGR